MEIYNLQNKIVFAINFYVKISTKKQIIENNDYSGMYIKCQSSVKGNIH